MYYTGSWSANRQQFLSSQYFKYVTIFKVSGCIGFDIDSLRFSFFSVDVKRV